MVNITSLSNNTSDGVTGGEGGDDDYISPEEKHLEEIFRSILIIMGSTAAILNFTVVTLYANLGKARKKFPNYMLLCAAISDIFVMGLAWGYYALSLINDGGTAFHKLAITVYGFVEYSFSLCLGTLFLSALDRMISVVRPLVHRNLMMKPRIRYVIIIVWLLSLIPALGRTILAKFSLDFMYWGEDLIFIYCYRSVLIFFIFMIISILTITCIKVSKIIRNPMHTVSTMKRGGEESAMALHRRNARVIKIFIGMICTFAISFLPITMMMFLYGTGHLNHIGHIQMLSIVMACDLMYVASCVINPLITITLKEDYRRRFMKFFRKKGSLVYQRRSNAIPSSGRTQQTSSARTQTSIVPTASMTAPVPVATVSSPAATVPTTATKAPVVSTKSHPKTAPESSAIAPETASTNF